VWGDARAAEGGGDAGGVDGEGAVHGAELRLQHLRRAGHVRVERRDRDLGRVRATPGDAQGGSGSGTMPRPREGCRAAASGGGRHRRGRSKASERTNRSGAGGGWLGADYPCALVVCRRAGRLKWAITNGPV
jgi:hypothetical protein